MKRISLLPILIILFFCEKPLNDCHLLSNSSEVYSSKLSRKVLVLSLDGVRSDAMNENNSPFMFVLSATKEFLYLRSN